jgi:hypothetical protein
LYTYNPSATNKQLLKVVYLSTTGATVVLTKTSTSAKACQNKCQACQFTAKLVSELHYICINTVPEIMYALSALTMSMAWATSQHYGYAKPVLPYLKGVKHLKLTWCAQTVNLKPRCSVANSLALPMPAGPTTSLRAAAR